MLSQHSGNCFLFLEKDDFGKVVSAERRHAAKEGILATVLEQEPDKLEDSVSSLLGAAGAPLLARVRGRLLADLVQRRAEDDAITRAEAWRSAKQDVDGSNLKDLLSGDDRVQFGVDAISVLSHAVPDESVRLFVTTLKEIHTTKELRQAA
eukprot:5862433-Prymnesium_polylepis.1